MRIKFSLFCAAVLIAGTAQAQAPLSAIDWLSQGLTVPEALPQSVAEPVASGSPAPEVITVVPLDGVSSDAVGLLPVSVTGLPQSLWGGTPSAELAAVLNQIDTDLLPALQELLFTLLLAELDPPNDSDPSARLFLARIDTLMAMGAVEQAQALLVRAGADTPEKFRRWFEASLLTGTEDAACERLRDNPNLSPTLPARIFCLARGGDWEAAVLTLETGRALGELGADEDALLARFLDLGDGDHGPALPLPVRPDALEFRIFEAIGEALTTTNMPLAFAHADLGPNSGWKAQIIAAERLARSGAIPANQLLGLYTERLPAASGGIWDRAQSVQYLEQALTSRDQGAVSTSLPVAWNALSGQSLQPAFAELYATSLKDFDLSADAAALAFRIGLLSRDYESVAAGYQSTDPSDLFLIGVARGDVAGLTASDPVAQAVADGFAATGASEPLAGLVRQGRLGEAILRAINMSTQAVRGDLQQLPDALALFRSVGLEDIARRTGLQILLLDSRG